MFPLRAETPRSTPRAAIPTLGWQGEICMSFRAQPPMPARPNRCQLFGPGSRPAVFEKMAASAADVVNLDLEDAVAPSSKDEARENVIAAVNDLHWPEGKILSVRINGLDTPFWYRDVVELLERAGERLDLIMIPKVGCAADLYAVEALASSVESACNRKKPVGFEVILESAAGLVNAAEIAAATPRLQAMSFGVADFSASMGMRVTGIGGSQAGYGMLGDATEAGERGWHLGDPWHAAVTRMVAACRMHGVLPVDGPFGDFSDDDGYRAQACRAAILGCVGKWAIHPKQVALANDVFTPSEEVVRQAERILSAMQEAEARGDGAAVLDGKLIDIASVRQASGIVGQMRVIRQGR